MGDPVLFILALVGVGILIVFSTTQRPSPRPRSIPPGHARFQTWLERVESDGCGCDQWLAPHCLCGGRCRCHWADHRPREVSE